MILLNISNTRESNTLASRQNNQPGSPSLSIYIGSHSMTTKNFGSFPFAPPPTQHKYVMPLHSKSLCKKMARASGIFTMIGCYMLFENEAKGGGL